MVTLMVAKKIHISFPKFTKGKSSSVLKKFKLIATLLHHQVIALITGELTLNIHWKDWCWGWSCNTLVTWWGELTHWKRTWCWERLKTGGEGATEDEMVGWHHQLNGYELEQTQEDSEGQESLAYCSHGVAKSWTQLRKWTATKWQWNTQTSAFAATHVLAS